MGYVEYNRNVRPSLSNGLGVVELNPRCLWQVRAPRIANWEFNPLDPLAAVWTAHQRRPFSDEALVVLEGAPIDLVVSPSLFLLGASTRIPDPTAAAANRQEREFVRAFVALGRVRSGAAGLRTEVERRAVPALHLNPKKRSPAAVPFFR